MNLANCLLRASLACAALGAVTEARQLVSDILPVLENFDDGSVITMDQLTDASLNTYDLLELGTTASTSRFIGGTGGSPISNEYRAIVRVSDGANTLQGIYNGSRFVVGPTVESASFDLMFSESLAADELSRTFYLLDDGTSVQLRVRNALPSSLEHTLLSAGSTGGSNVFGAGTTVTSVLGIRVRFDLMDPMIQSDDQTVVYVLVEVDTGGTLEHGILHYSIPENWPMTAPAPTVALRVGDAVAGSQASCSGSTLVSAVSPAPTGYSVGPGGRLLASVELCGTTQSIVEVDGPLGAGAVSLYEDGFTIYDYMDPNFYDSTLLSPTLGSTAAITMNGSGIWGAQIEDPDGSITTLGRSIVRFSPSSDVNPSSGLGIFDGETPGIPPGVPGNQVIWMDFNNGGNLILPTSANDIQIDDHRFIFSRGSYLVAGATTIRQSILRGRLSVVETGVSEIVEAADTWQLQSVGDYHVTSNGRFLYFHGEFAKVVGGVPTIETREGLYRMTLLTPAEFAKYAEPGNCPGAYGQATLEPHPQTPNGPLNPFLGAPFSFDLSLPTSDNLNPTCLTFGQIYFTAKDPASFPDLVTRTQIASFCPTGPTSLGMFPLDGQFHIIGQPPVVAWPGDPGLAPTPVRFVADPLNPMPQPPVHGRTDLFPLTIPNDPTLVGESFYAQGLIFSVDFSGGFADTSTCSPTRVTNGLWMRIGDGF